ncbi:MAG: ABC transporter permease [Saccharofermentanales bacterium]|jgi:ABC-type dipeptide/oligopeptide/nickel transport system permease subunit|nr:ABC transporter permease [Clostridiaceae bacterium]
MAKRMTPAIARFKKKHAGKTIQVSTPGKEAWRRLRRNRTALLGLAIILLMLIAAIFAGWIAPYEYQQQIYADAYQTPNARHLFGTDNFGRDLFSRCVYGARYSLSLGLMCVIASFLTGGMLGVIAGYFGGRVDNLIMRFMDMFQAIPQVMLAISITAALGNGIPQMITAITVSTMPTISKNCRAAILNVKNADYVESSRAIGVGRWRMIFRHMIPNSVGVMVIFVVGLMGATINMMASLSYLGVGLNPPTPEWGLILSDGKGFFTAYPHMVLFPSLMILFTILAFNMLGDGLRDAFDPRLK